MEDYLADELVLIGCRHAAREKHFSRKRKNMCLTPFSLQEDRTARPTQIKYCLMEIDITVDERWTHFAHDTLLLCRGMRKRLSFVLIWLARPKILDGPKHDFYLGTERTAMNSFVPFLPVPQGRIGLTHALTLKVWKPNTSDGRHLGGTTISPTNN